MRLQCKQSFQCHKTKTKHRKVVKVKSTTKKTNFERSILNCVAVWQFTIVYSVYSVGLFVTNNEERQIRVQTSSCCKCRCTALGESRTKSMFIVFFCTLFLCFLVSCQMNHLFCTSACFGGLRVTLPCADQKCTGIVFD